MQSVRYTGWLSDGQTPMWCTLEGSTFTASRENASTMPDFTIEAHEVSLKLYEHDHRFCLGRSTFKAQNDAALKYWVDALRHVVSKVSARIGGELFTLPPHMAAEKVLGRGSYGTVISAIDQSTNETVAIKCIKNILDSGEDAKRIIREMRVLRLLQHPNIPHLKDIFFNRERVELFLVQRKMDTTLRRIIESSQKLSAVHVCHFTWQMLRGISYLHSFGIMHRDIKPDNILVNADCYLQLCDLGLCQNVSPSAITDYVVTRWYRAPEVMLMPREYGPAVDLWSIGCIMAELYRRKPLFCGEGYIDQLNRIFCGLGKPEDVSWVTGERARKFVSELDSFDPLSLSDLGCGGMCENAQNLFRRMLAIDPRERITADEALQHDFIRRNAESWEADENVQVVTQQDLTEEQLQEITLEDIVATSNTAIREALVQEVEQPIVSK